MNVATDVPVLSPNFSTESFIADPWPILEEIRRAGPVVFHAELNQYMVHGYRDVARMLGDARTFRSEYDMFVKQFGAATMECLDDPLHAMVKGVWSGDFTRDSLEKNASWIAEVISKQFDSFAAELDSADVTDAIGSLIRPIPTRVISRMLGIPAEDHLRFSAWSEAMAMAVEADVQVGPRAEELARLSAAGTAATNAYLTDVIRDKRVKGSTDLIGRMATSDVFERIAIEEAVANCTQLVFAGQETTIRLMGNVLMALEQHPEQRAAVAEDRTLVPAAIEEVQRWNPVVHGNWRHVRGDHAEIAGVTLPAGAKIVGLQGAANRDPQRWDQPEVFDIFRERKQHLGFGFGPHVCLGLNLTRLEVQIWINQFLDRYPNYRVVGEPTWGSNWVVRGATRLMVAA